MTQVRTAPGKAKVKAEIGDKSKIKLSKVSDWPKMIKEKISAKIVRAQS